MDKNIKIKITDNTRSKDPEISQYSVAYSSKNMHNSQASYEIISALKAKDNIIIEVNSSLLSLSENDHKELCLKLTSGFKEMGVEYRNKSITMDAKKTIFSIGLRNKKIEGFEMLIFTPHEVWCDSRFRDLLPNIGVKYYIPKAGYEINLDEFFSSESKKRAELCKMVIFDFALLGSMGINTTTYNKDNIIELLSK